MKPKHALNQRDIEVIKAALMYFLETTEDVTAEGVPFTRVAMRGVLSKIERMENEQ